MSLSQQIEKDYITAYKAKDTLRVSVLACPHKSLPQATPGGHKPS